MMLPIRRIPLPALFGPLAVALLSILASSAQAQTNVATSAAPFLTIGVGARAMGMGGAYVSMVEDASALFWNPAGAAEAQRSGLLLQHSEWLADIDFEYAALLTSGPFGGIAGISFTTLDLGEMEVTTIEEAEGTGQRFSARDLALGAAYAVALTDQFSIGGTLKYIRQSIWNESATGWAVDVGTIYRVPWRALTIGSSISNFGTRMRMSGLDLRTTKDLDDRIEGNNGFTPADLETAAWNLPLLLRVGLSLDLFQGGLLPTRFALDALHPNDNSESLNLGLETGLSDLLFLRGGWNRWRPQNLLNKISSNIERDETVEGGLTLGLGLDASVAGLGNLSIDYAYLDHGRLRQSQFFALGLMFQ